jgi:thiamine pyrophosphate-dependent acetolactate synthase large subunit-like protein
MKQANQFTGLYLGDPDIEFVTLANSRGVEGIKVDHPSELPKALKRGIDATRSGVPFLIDVNVRRVGIGADSEWYQKFSLAKKRKKHV